MSSRESGGEPSIIRLNQKTVVVEEQREEIIVVRSLM